VELAREQELAAEELLSEQELQQEQELVPAQELAAVPIMLSETLTPAHMDRLTRTIWAGECFRFKGVIRLGIVADGLVADGLAALLVGMCGGMRRACAISTGLTKPSGSMLRSSRAKRPGRRCLISNPSPVPEQMILRRPAGRW
jgi:hypothetical protein